MRMLEKVSLFTGLSPRDLSAIAACALTRTFAPKAVILSEGERSDSLYVVLYGRVKVYVSDRDGAEVILGIIGARECFGEMALMDDTPRSASIMTLESTRLSIVSKNAFKECLVRNPDIAYNLIRALNQRVRTLSENVKNFALLDVNGRVARILRSLAVTQGDSLVIEQRLTHQQIASMVGASREMVSRVLKDLTKKGYIETEGKRITIRQSMPKAW